MQEIKQLSKKDLKFLQDLETLLYKRKDTMPSGSYTTWMFKKGLDKIAQKLGEEAVETVIASKNEDDRETVEEVADLLFHLMLLLAEKQIPLHEIVKVLRKRYEQGDHKHIS